MADFTLQELKDIQAEYIKAQADGIPISKELAQRYKDATIGIKNYSRQLEDSVKRFGSSLLTSVMSSERGASKYNDALTSGADAISDFAMRFGPLGMAAGMATKGLAMFAGAVTKQSDALFKTYQDLSQTGITGSQGLKGVFDNLQNFGFTVDKITEYTSLLQNNADIMNRFGSTANEGAARMGEITKTIRDSSAGKNLRLLGMSSEAIANSTLGYARLQTMLGASAKMTDQELIEGGTKYAEELLKSSKLTGASTDKLKDSDQKVVKHAQMGSALALKRQLAYDSQDKGLIAAYENEKNEILKLNREIESRYGPEIADAVLSLKSGGPPNEAAQKLLRTMPDLYAMAQRKGSTVEQIIDTANKEVKARGTVINQMRMVTGDTKTFVDVETQNRLGDQKDRKEAEIQANKEVKVTDKATQSATNLDITQQNITQALDSLVNLGINPVTSALSSIANKINFLLDPFGRKTVGGAKAAQEQNVAASQGSVAQQVTGGATAELSKEEQLKYGVDATGRSTGQAPVAPKAATPNQTAPATPSTPDIGGPESSSSMSMPSAAKGGILSGPRSGYTATLHGTEAVVPLPDGRTIPVEMPDLSGVLTDQSHLLDGVLQTLDDIVKNMETQVAVSKKILMRTV